MTTKTIKTFLFASLIAAMILPFSMMDYAVAEKANNISDKIDKLIEQYNTLEVERQQLKADLKVTVGEENREIILQKITNIEERQDKIEAIAVKLAEQETEYTPSKSPGEIRMQAITTGSTINVFDMHTACDNGSISGAPSSVSGWIDTNSDTIDWSWGVADAKSVGWFWPFCNNVYYDRIDFITRNNSEGLSCTMKSSNQDAGNETQTCNCGISEGDLLSWAVQTTYEPQSGTDTSGNNDWRGLHRV